MIEWDRTENSIFHRCSKCRRGISAEFTEEGLKKAKEEFEKSGRKAKLEKLVLKEVERLGGIDNVMNLSLGDVLTEIFGNVLHDLSNGKAEIIGPVRVYGKRNRNSLSTKESKEGD